MASQDGLKGRARSAREGNCDTCRALLAPCEGYLYKQTGSNLGSSIFRRAPARPVSWTVRCERCANLSSTQRIRARRDGIAPSESAGEQIVRLAGERGDQIQFEHVGLVATRADGTIERFSHWHGYLSMLAARGE